uniref:CUB domain-containing protein n=1 Tax=Dendroctonus ponderosae TaxID=77166 RepID=A0AAR5P6J0_DENPD
MLKLALRCALFGLVTCGFFDFSEVDDPFAMLWNSHVGQKLRECSVDGNTKGTCMDKSACLQSGGKPIFSKCPFFKTCCSYSDKNNCVGESNAKQGHFESGKVATNLTDCRYTINLKNRNVCQVRLDFEELVLAPTVKVDSTAGEQFMCTDDYLKISPSYYGIPILCGPNTNQHVYVHFNLTERPDQAVTIEIHLKNRVDYPKLVVPSWKIKFTQLECPLKRPKFDPATYGEVGHINNDFNLLAPHGAIQYFPDSSGNLSSFGYTGTDNYVMPLYYAIAFRRPASTCGVKFSNVNIAAASGMDATVKVCYHYLFVPEATAITISARSNSLSLLGASVAEDYGDHFCGTISNSDILSAPPGPFYIHFKATSVLTAVNNIYPSDTTGFSMNYEITSCS